MKGALPGKVGSHGTSGPENSTCGLVPLEGLGFRRTVQRDVTKPGRHFAELAPGHPKTLSKSAA